MTPEERVKDIKSIISRSNPGLNEIARQKIHEHVTHLRSLVSGAYPSGKLHDIIQYSDIYFSQRKHKQYAGGAEQVTVWVLAGCSTVRDFLPSPGA